MANFYIENEKGTIMSQNGERRFVKLSGKEAYEFLRCSAGKGKRFIKTGSDEDGANEDWVEVPRNHIRAVRKAERHEQYASDCLKESGYMIVSMYPEDSGLEGEAFSGEEVIGDPNCNVEEQALHNIELETLKNALKTLTDEEMQLVYHLYLRVDPLTVRELGELMGAHFATISKRRNAVLAKLRNFFE